MVPTPLKKIEDARHSRSLTTRKDIYRVSDLPNSIAANLEIDAVNSSDHFAADFAFAPLIE